MRLAAFVPEAGLPEPEMIEQDDSMLITLFKNMVGNDQLTDKKLNNRQTKAILYVKDKGSISNAEYQHLFNVARNTATRDLSGLVKKGFLKSPHTKGTGAYYELIAS